jgi:hypothetical protein
MSAIALIFYSTIAKQLTPTLKLDLVEHDSLKKHLSERMTEREYLILDRISVYTRKFESEYIKDKSMLKNCNNECTPVKNEWQLKHCLFSNSSPILRIEKFADFRYWSIDH